MAQAQAQAHTIQRKATTSAGTKALRAYNKDDRTDKPLCAFGCVVCTYYSCATPVAVGLVVLMLLRVRPGRERERRGWRRSNVYKVERTQEEETGATVGVSIVTDARVRRTP